jgi:hypothetical protein
MNLEVTTNMILSQLKYTVNDSSIAQANNAIKETINFNKFAKHLISLNDNLQHINAYIALSNNSNKFKIKFDNLDNGALLEEFHEIVKKWSNKYKVSLETIPNKEVYYIIGAKHE